MKKFWFVYNVKNIDVLLRYETREEAVNEAKRMQAYDAGAQFIVLEAILATVRQVPAVEMEELK